MLLNIGPLPTGEFPSDQVVILEKMGKWLKRNGESIYGTRGGPIHNRDWGGVTQKGKKIYVHVLNWPQDGSPLIIPGINYEIIRSKGFNVGNPKVRQTSIGIEIVLPEKERDELYTIILLEVKNN